MPVSNTREWRLLHLLKYELLQAERSLGMAQYNEDALPGFSYQVHVCEIQSLSDQLVDLAKERLGNGCPPA